MSNTITPTVFYRTLNMEGLEIFYREAGPRVDGAHTAGNAGSFFVGSVLQSIRVWRKNLQKPA